MRIAVLSIFAAAAAPAWAGDVTVDVRDQTGRAVENAVVLVRPAGGAAGQPVRFTWPLVMTQQDIAFQPYVLIVPVGSTVNFPNKDRVRHHVYSFSAARRFELKLYGRDETRSVTFDKPGAVPLGCNIHDQMIAYIYVSDTPFAMKTGASGQATLRGVPAGAATLTVWHPNLKARTPAAVRLSVGAGPQRQAAAIELHAAPAR